jgi:endonuclease/exonuclease/phosphatase (EEP) superfamily protein YafD
MHTSWLKTTLRRLVTLTILSYGVLILAWYLAFRAIGDGLWWLGLLNAFALYLFVPLPPLAILALLTRQRRAWLALLGAGAIFAALFGDLLVPPIAVTHAGAPRPGLTVMSYNVFYVNPDAAAIAASVREAEPDLVAFQELTKGQAAALETLLGDEYPYRSPLHAECLAEVAIWSRHPLTVEPGPADVTCRVRSVRVAWGGRAIRVVNVHGWPYASLAPEDVARDFRWRREQMADVLAALEGQPEPLVLLGDLNSTSTQEVYQMVTEAGLTDAFREAGWGVGHTFPATGGRFLGIPYPARLVRIDHVFHSPEWYAEAAHVGAWDGHSDHHPVIAQLRLRAPD